MQNRTRLQAAAPPSPPATTTMTTTMHKALLLATLLLMSVSALPAPLEHYDLRTCNNTSIRDGTIPSRHYNDAAGGENQNTNSISLTGALVPTAAQDFVYCDPPDWGTHTINDLGTRKDRMEGNRTLTEFQNHFFASSPGDVGGGGAGVGRFSVSIWLTPAYSFYSARAAILTLGDTKRQPYVTQECQGFDFRVVQLSETLVISFTDSQTYCQSLRVAPVVLTRVLTHAAITFGETSMQVYVDGLPVYAEGYLGKTLDVRNWKRAATSTLQLFSNYQDDAVFQGRLHQVDLYDRTLTAADVATMFAHGVGYVEPPPREDENGNNNNGTNGTSTHDDDDDDDSNEEMHHLAAMVPGPAEITQDATEPIAIELRGYNKTTMILQLAVQVTSLPSHGTLFYTNKSINGTETNIEVNSIFPFSGNVTGITVFYKLDSADYFNVPTTNAHGMNLHLSPESFDFRIVALNNTSQLLPPTQVMDASETLSVPVHVIHVNHGAPTLTAPKEAVLDARKPSKASVKGSAGIVVTDATADYNMDRVRVDVWSEGGTLTLNPSHLALADFDTCAFRSLSAWQCMGGDGGDHPRRLTFVAVPDDVALILRNIVFESFAAPGVAGEIGVRIYDGAGGNCLHETEHAAYSRDVLGSNYTTEHHGECYEVQAIIVVPGFDANNDNGSDGQGGLTILGFEWKELAFGVSAITLTLLCTCGCCGKLLRCVARGKAVTPDADAIPPNDGCLV